MRARDFYQADVPSTNLLDGGKGARGRSGITQTGGSIVKKLALLATGISVLGFASGAYAADHLFTATAAGGLTEDVSQPFLNGTNNPGRSGESVPGQGSPLSGDDHATPATDTVNHGVGTTPKPVTDGKTAPSANSGKIP
jgi:hypothetical protein